MPAPITVPAIAETRPACEPNSAPAARLSNGRGTKAAVHAPYATANSITAAAPPSWAGKPPERSLCGSYRRTSAAAVASMRTSSDSRDQGDNNTRVQRTASGEAGLGTGSNIRRQ